MLIGSRYEAIERIGEGASGEVWSARDLLRAGRPVAVKLLRKGAYDEEAVRRFRDEVRLLERLRHPGILAIHEAGYDHASGRPFSVTDRIEGPDVLSALTGAPVAAVFRCLCRLAAALDFIHRRGFVHADLKPAHVLVAPGDRPVLLDLGLARAIARSAADPPAGTLPYTAPEILAGKPADGRADLYSLGVILFQLVEQRLPFDGDTPEEIVRAHLEGARPAIGAASRGPLSWLVPWVERMLSRDPEERPASAGEMTRPWAAALEAEPLPPEEESLPYLTDPPLVGRDEIDARVEDALRTVAGGGAGGPILVLEGPGGSGRSRLLREARISARLRGVAVCEARGGAGESDAWIDVLTDLSPVARDLGPAYLSRLEDCGEILRRGKGEGSDPGVALTGLLAEISARRPVLILLDDADGLDARSGRLLDTIAGQIDGLPVQIVMARLPRGEDGPSGPGGVGRLERSGTLARLPLAALSEADVDRLVRDCLGLPRLPDGLAAALHRASSGSPFLLRVALENLAVRGLLRLDRGRWSLPEDADVAAVVPSGVDEVLGSRLARISGADLRLVADLAELGERVPLAIAREVTRSGEGELDALLDRLANEGVVEPPERTPGRVAFCHARLRDLLRSQCGEDRRIEVHRRALEAYRKADGGDAVVAVARHAIHSGQTDVALDSLRAAADRAVRLQAPAEAAGHLRKLLSLHPAASPERRGAALDLASCLVDAGEQGEALDVLTALESDPDLEPGLLPRVVGRKARALIMRHPDRPDGLEEAARCVALATERGDWATAITACKDRAVGLARRGRYGEALPIFEQTIDLLRKHPDQGMGSEIFNSLALTHLFLGNLDEAEQRLLESQSLAFSSGRKSLLASTFHNLSLVHRKRGRWEAAAEAAGAATRLFRELGHGSHYGDAIAGIARSQRALGRYDEALDRYAAARAAHRKGPDPSREAYLLDAWGDLLRVCGRTDEALSLHAEALDLAREHDDPVQRVYASAALARDHLQAGHADRARADAEQAVVLAESVESLRARADAALSLAAVDLARGRHEPALASIGRLLDRHTGDLDLEELEIEALLLRARALSALGRNDEAGETARAGVDRAVASRLIEERARALSVKAESEELASMRSRALRSRHRAADLVRKIASRISDTALRRDYLAVPWRKDLLSQTAVESVAEASGHAEQRLETLYDIVASINSLLEPEMLLERVVDKAVALVRAERGLIILIHPVTGDHEVKIARGMDRQTVSDATEYSRNIVRRAGQGQSVLAIDAGEDQRFRDFKSVSLLRIKSLMCVPLRLRDRIIGTVYLDSRRSGIGFSPEDLRFLEAFAHHAAIALDNARLHSELREENELLRRTSQQRHSFGKLIGRSEAMREAFEVLERAAASSLPVLIVGESGTGKELVASALHFNGPRRSGPFVSQNCSAIPESLLESEVFGHVRGAFTGADRDRKGLFELAHKGTLFLDEIGDLPLATQPKLLRVLQEGEFRPVGARRTVKADVRIISATNRDLKTLLEEGRFREDLFYRLNVLNISLPPLRERREDIPLLVERFLEQSAAETGVTGLSIDDDLLSLLVRYDWPGNVRQLENAIARLSVIARGSRLGVEDLRSDTELASLVGPATGSEPVDSLKAVERREIRRALEETAGNRQKAAKLLGISKATIFRKIREYDLR